MKSLIWGICLLLPQVKFPPDVGGGENQIHVCPNLTNRNISKETATPVSLKNPQ